MKNENACALPAPTAISAKSLISAFMSALMILSLLLTSCSTAPTDETTSPDTEPTPEESTAISGNDSTEATAAETDAETDAETSAESRTMTDPLGDGTVPESLKILAIGNSFSTDTMQYLYQVCQSMGVKNIVLGNMYISGCSLATHLQHAQQGDGAYTYHKNTTGTWVSTKSVALKTGVQDEDWDIITLQQTSKTCGLPATYGSTLTKLVDIVESLKTNENAKLLWHMTWAYQQDSTHSSFPNYDSSQTKMYQMIIDTVQKCIMTESRFDGIIPVGTAIQNVRTGFIGDTITRDGYHLNLTLGRYIGALTWFAYITGADVSDIKYVVASDINEDCRKLAVESVMNAVKNPLEVTESKITTGTWTASTSEDKKTAVNYEDCFEADKTLAATVGVNLDNYTLLEYEYIENAYYCCTKGTGLTTPSSSASTYHQNICTKKIYSKEEIPENSIIICDSGWQYRPEMWTSLDKAAASRPSITSANITLMDKTYWGSLNYFAFNISSSPKSDISTFYAAAATHIRIYVPKS